MIGYHEVRVFFVPRSEAEEGWAAPTNWKPFTTEVTGTHVIVSCRKFHNEHLDKGRKRFLGDVS